MDRFYPHPSLEERRQIANWRYAKTQVSEITGRLDRDASTIYRKIKRTSCRFDDQPELNGYHALTAQDWCEERRAVLRKLIIYPQIMAAERSGFDAGWSPEQIVGRMRLERHPMRVSQETIYRYAYSKDGRAEQFYQHLPRHRRSRRPCGMRKQHGSQFLDELAIKHRPEVIAKPEEFGRWECDWVMFRKEFGKANVTSLVERVTRYAVVLKNPDRQSKPIIDGLIDSLSSLPAHACQSITKEYLRLDKLERQKLHFAASSQ